MQAPTTRTIFARQWRAVALMALPATLSAQSPDVQSRMTEVLRYAGAPHATPADATRMAQLWDRAQQADFPKADRWLAFRDLLVAYAALQGRDLTAQPQALDRNARFAAAIFEGGGRMDLTLPEPRGRPSGNYLHVATHGRGSTPLLLISDAGVDGGKLYGSFVDRQGSAYTMHVATLPFAGGARPLPWPDTVDYAKKPWLTQIERELLDLVDRPAMKGVTVVGTAAGGYFAARLALLRPEQVRAAVLVNALVRMEMRSPSDAKTAASFAERLQVVRSIPPAPQLWPVAPIPARDEVRRLIADPASMHPSVQNWMAFAVRDTAVSRAWTWEALTGGFFLPGNQYRWELTTTDLTDALRDLRVPMLAIGSRHDAASPMKIFPAISQWEELRALYPTIPLTMVVVDSARHYVSADAPAEFDRALAAFLAAHPRRFNW